MLPEILDVAAVALCGAEHNGRLPRTFRAVGARFTSHIQRPGGVHATVALQAMYSNSYQRELTNIPIRAARNAFIRRAFRSHWRYRRISDFVPSMSDTNVGRFEVSADGDLKYLIFIFHSRRYTLFVVIEQDDLPEKIHRPAEP
ncbi:hypothetical protein QPK32_17580 [Massilia sp. YIM B02763]|uniref:hypothetical protein n=1 Tax=Massilia sp. YIM B02763 TaxID=3050130 RepID=UPI0025B6DCF0|nr:hypothetical protein [Massilia sp. YIM B02763]MDN4054894.1 hypothetical protein [Massilia sp. YIM B02763]